VNRVLAGDVRRGMYVTALYALIDTVSGKTRLACAGHKVPLIRHSAADGKLQTVQPEGIALGMDKGPIFDRTLQISTLTMELGDRLVLANTGPAQVMNEDETPIGDKGFYRLLLKLSGETSKMMLDGVLMGLESYAGEEPYPNDLAIVTVCREG
jgi:sigma-B regulation protein RsbU (phosphoserine phosphatase)